MYEFGETHLDHSTKQRSNTGHSTPLTVPLRKSSDLWPVAPLSEDRSKPNTDPHSLLAFLTQGPQQRGLAP